MLLYPPPANKTQVFFTNPHRHHLLHHHRRTPPPPIPELEPGATDEDATAEERLEPSDDVKPETRPVSQPEPLYQPG